MQRDARNVPIDEISRKRLAERGLDYRTVPTDGDGFAPFQQASARGFLEGEATAELIEAMRRWWDERRTRSIAVYDAGSTETTTPAATVASWVTPLTVPGGELDMWAISDVTVAGTHRRRGIARAMLEGELRAAADAGLAIAGLTVSEATIYGRYGFGPAIPVAGVRVDTRRAGWIGGAPALRPEYVERADLADALAEVHERSRAERVGDIAGFSSRWERIAGIGPGQPDGTKTRGIVVRDETGAIRGAMAFTLTPDETDFTKHTLAIGHLVGDGADARAALWRFALQHDLVSTVTAQLQPVDDALPWLVADQRAVIRTVHDHGWLRILDLPAAFGARTYAADADVTIRVRDPLGFADGTWRLHTGRAIAEPSAADPDIELGVAELATVFLGGAPLAALADAGRASGDAAAIRALDAALRPARAPHLSIWY